MQDRPKIEDDQSLVDRGWKQMSYQLDEVMPVRKKRFFPWFLLLLFIAMGSSAGIYKTFYNGENLNEKTSTPSPTIIKEAGVLKNPIAATSSVKAEKSTESVQTTAVSFLSGNTSTSKEELTTTNVISVPRIVKPPIENEVNTKNSGFEPLNNTREVSVPDPNYLESSIATVDQPRENSIVDLLSDKPLQLLTNKVKEHGKTIKPASTSKYHLYVMSEAELGLGSSPQGLAAGVGLQWSVSRKASLDFGLNYQYVTADLITEPLGFSQRSIADSNNLSQGGIYAPTGLSVDQAYRAMEVHRLNIPVQFRYRASSRWYLGAGLQASFYHKAIVKVEEVGSADVTEFSSDFRSQNLYNDNLSVYTLDEVTNEASASYDLDPKRWQYSALISTQFQLSPRIQLEAKYRTNISNWPDDKESYGAKSFVALGVKYLVR